MLVFHIIPIVGVGELDFFLLMIFCYECVQGFFIVRDIPKSTKQADGSKLPNKNRASLQTAFKQFGYF